MKWDKKEKNTLLRLLKKTKNVSETCRIYAEKSGRSEAAIKAYIKYAIKKGELPAGLGRTHKVWTKEEIKDLLKLVSTYPHNLKEAYRIHAENTDRNLRAVKSFFEGYRRREDAKVCMMTIGAFRMASPNRKNISTRTGGKATPLKVPKWKRILAILFELFFYL